MFRGLWAVFWKEVIHIRRDPATRFIFAVPLVPLLLFGYAIEMDVQNIPTVVFDLNRKNESRELVKAFESTRYFRVVAYVHSDRDLERRL